MNNLWIFNPDNDIALGNNLSNFTAPRNALMLRHAGAMLMAWLAADGDCIFSSSPFDNEWLSTMSPILGKELTLYSPDSANRITGVQPWGWSRAIARFLERNGIAANLLPVTSRLDIIRELSHRRSSVLINRQLMLAGVEVSMPMELSDIQPLKEILHSGSGWVIKSPWSSSGRGVIYSDSMNTNRILELAQGIIRGQGSVLVEPKLDKQIDFAMLFDVRPEGVVYIGLSVFNTLKGGNYSGNIVASDDYLSAILTRYVEASSLEVIKSNLETILQDLIGEAYTGICGVDMMIYADVDGHYHVAPCVELNLRNTMGYIAHRLGRDIIAPGKTGSMTVTFIGNKTGSSLQLSGPPIFDLNNKLMGGSLSLIPPNNSFDIRLTID